MSAAANDAVASGINRAAFYDRQGLQLDPGMAASEVCASLAAQGLNGFQDLSIRFGVSGPGADPPVVTLSATAEVNEIFGRAVPGFGEREVAAAVTVAAEQDEGSPPPPEATAPLTC